MKVYLVQHGMSKSKGEDPERPLSQEGIEASEKMALYVSQQHVHVSSIYHSRKLRAFETAEIFARHLNCRDKVEENNSLSPNNDPAIWKERLDDGSEDIMLVGHLPHLNKLSSLFLCGESDREIVSFSNSGVLCLENNGICWVIKWMVIPQFIG